MLSASSLLAVTGSSVPSAFQLTRTTISDHGQFDTLLLQKQDSQSSGFGLTHFETNHRLVGSDRIQPKEVLHSLAPHLEGLDLKLMRNSKVNQTAHFDFALYMGSFRIEGAQLMLTYRGPKLVSLRSNLPAFRLPEQFPTESDFLPLEELGIDSDPIQYKLHSEKVIYEAGDFPTPAWWVERTDLATGTNQRLVIDAQTGAVLVDELANFGMAHVYPENPNDKVLETVIFPDLLGNGYLESTDFIVFAPTPEDPRVFSPDGLFEFDPNSPAEAIEFDQVQSYYNGARILDWFTSRFGYDDQGVQMQIRVNDSPDGDDGNSTYTPAPNGPMIRVGRGNDTLHNLARDSDVMAHEFSHHVIFQSIKLFSGQSRHLHEGYADYFTYAFNQDPYLGETIVFDKAYLRTARPEEKYGFYVRYDDPTKPEGTYVAAEIWSAMLWTIREAVGEDFDEVVYNSLNYLGHVTSYREALYGLLESDRDLNPLEKDVVDSGIYGQNKCLILKTAIQRGYATYLEELDGASCGFDLVKAADDSRSFTDAKNNPDVKSRPLFSCATVGTNSKLWHWLGWVFFLLPFGIVWSFNAVKRELHKNEDDHGS
jgi:hypothetical protein